MKNKSPTHYQKTLLLMMVITAVAVDVSVPITDYFQVNKNRAPLIISSFLAGYGFSMIPVGLLSDRDGRLPRIFMSMDIAIPL